jgi:hypothetical protein
VGGRLNYTHTRSILSRSSKYITVSIRLLTAGAVRYGTLITATTTSTIGVTCGVEK